MSFSKDNFQTPSSLAREKTQKLSLVASLPAGGIPHKALKHVVPLKKLRGKHTDQIVVFLLKVAALEAVRRLSKARCPVVWRVVQALQVLVCPPLNWIQRWGPLRAIVMVVQKFSRPLLCLSIATAFFDHSEISKRTSNRVDESRPDSESPNEPSTSDTRVDESRPDSESPNEPSTSDTRKSDESDDTSKNIVSENWLEKIRRELEMDGVSLSERFDEDELRRFYTAARGDLSCLLSSLKRTIRWRETYYLLSSQELENWSTLVFWHGFDVMLRPCLVIRLGFAISRLMPHDRPRFSQAVVSQIEYGILQLVNKAEPRISVLMDCEGLSPIRFPMQMLKSCATILQDHYPNRLAVLFVVRLPPISRVITQTFMKVLKPATRQKLRIEGQAYLKVLSEFFQSVPAFLGGNCTCPKCGMLLAGKTRDQTIEAIRKQETSDDTLHFELSPDDFEVAENLVSQSCEHYLRAAVIGILMLCIIIAFLAGMYDPYSSVAL